MILIIKGMYTPAQANEYVCEPRMDSCKHCRLRFQCAVNTEVIIESSKPNMTIGMLRQTFFGNTIYKDYPKITKVSEGWLDETTHRIY